MGGGNCSVVLKGAKLLLRPLALSSPSTQHAPHSPTQNTHTQPRRQLIQRRCQECGGSGLVVRGKYPKKCPECGGMFPWVSWRMFLSATATPGNGGPLLQPKGQTSVFYAVPPPPPAAQQQQGQQQQQQGDQQPQAQTTAAADSGSSNSSSNSGGGGGGGSA